MNANQINKNIYNKGLKKTLKTFKLDPLSKKILDLTNGQAILGRKIKILGSGSAGRVLECVNYKKCPLKWRRAVVKESFITPEFYNEVYFMKKINEYMKQNPGKDPIAPKYYGHFVHEGKGYILIQNVEYIFPKAKRVVQWANFSKSDRERFTHLNSLKNAMNKLHNTGIGHGNMHKYNLWIAELPRKQFKFIFTDFGRSYRYKIDKLTTVNNKWKYSNMVRPIKLSSKKNLNVPLMNNNKVFKSYTLRKKKLNSNKK